MFILLTSIKWIPKTFSFTSLSKAAKKRSDDPLASFRKILEPLDIKCIPDYVAEHTSHIVTSKRNTSAVLQALVNGRHVVTEPYLEPLAAAGKKDSPDEQSMLEIDFDTNWPREVDYLPPPGREPNPRPEHSEEFLPDEARSEMFSKYVFIFHDQSQYDSLMPVITGGGGKVLLRHIQHGETDVSGMVEYVREVAGKKGDTSFDLSQQVKKTTAGGIIILRVGNSNTQVPGYYDKLDQALGQRSMEQNEFLDAILDVDATKLKRGAEVHSQVGSSGQAELPRDRRDPLQRTSNEPSMAQREQQSPAREEVVPSQQHSAPASPEPAPRRRAARQRTTQPKFRGFEDFKPEESLPQYSLPSPSQSLREPSQAPSVDPMEANCPVDSQSQAFQTQKSATQVSQTQRSSRKRRGEPLEDDPETTKDVVDGLLKGAAVMKKRKLEEQRLKAASQPANGEDEDMEEADSVPQTTKKPPPRRRKEKEIDVMALVNERRQAEDEARQHDEEVLRAAFDGMDVGEIRNLAKVEEMDIIRRDPPPRAHNNEDGPSDRWDDRWNGRKNFKKFRRQGTAGTTYERQRTRVIVPLEEVQKKAYGVGEDYWLESVEDTRRKEKEKRKTQSQLRQSQVEASRSASRKSQSHSQRSRGRHSGASASAGAANDDEEDDGGMGLVHDKQEHVISDDDEDENDTTRFRRRIRNLRLQDAETADAEEIYPEEIAGTARDGDIEAAAHERPAAVASRGAGKSVGKSQTQTQTQGRKRGAADQGAGAPAAKKVRATGSRRAKTPIDEDEEAESEEEDALRFRRRRR